MVYNILDYGAVSDGVTLATVAIQSAIDDCHKNGGGKVIIPAGSFYSGSIFMRDNVELHLELGALLTASANMADYNADDAYSQNYGFPPEEWLGKHLIIAVECQNVAITGLGTIDGNGESFRTYPTPSAEGFLYIWMQGQSHVKDLSVMRPGQLICFIESKNVYVEGVTIRNAPAWCVFVHGCEYVRIHGIQVFNHNTAVNTDGIDIDSSRYVTISDCNIITGDDAITFRTSSKRLKNPLPSEYVTVTNCNLAVSASAFRIGVGKGHIRHIRVSNINIERASTAINYMTSYCGKGEAYIEDVNFSAISVNECSYPIELVGDRGYIKNVTIENFRANSIANVRINPADDCSISDITLRNIDCHIAFEDRELTDEHIAQRGSDMIYVGNAERVTLDCVNITYDEAVRPLWENISRLENPDEVITRNCNM